MSSHHHRQRLDRSEKAILDDPQSGAMASTAAVFTPDVVRAMSDGFDLAWGAVLAANLARAADRFASETRHQLAVAIVESARRGTRDCDRLRACALRSFLPLALNEESEGDRSAPK